MRTWVVIKFHYHPNTLRRPHSAEKGTFGSSNTWSCTFRDVKEPGPCVFSFWNVMGWRETGKPLGGRSHMILPENRCSCEVNGENPSSLVILCGKEKATPLKLKLIKAKVLLCFLRKDIFTESRGAYKDSLCNNNFTPMAVAIFW